MTVAFVIVLGVLVAAIVALPYLDEGLVEPVPFLGDPVLRDLAEERAALLRAVHELDAREDLAPARRDELRDRYERKAAQVVQRMDERGAPPAPRRRRPVPLGWGLLLVLLVPSVALIGNYVVPRVNAGGTVTTNRAAEITAGRNLQRLQRAARDEPTAATLLALGDAYWALLDESLQPPSPGATPSEPRYVEETRETYAQVLALTTDVPVEGTATALRRLAFVDLIGGNVDAALPRLERAVEVDPTDAEALYTLGQVRYFMGRVGEAVQAWRAYLETPAGASDEATAQLAADAEALARLIDAAEEDRTVENVLAVADRLWEMEDRQRAGGFYAEVVTELEVEHPRAVRRLGMALFFAGNTEQAVLALERARELEAAEPETLLFLGNAYRALGEPDRAVEAWREYVTAVGGEENAGRVPGLIAEALGGAAGGAAVASVAADPGDAESTGAALFAANCSACHGPSGGGGSGPRLAGNPRAGDAGLVASTVRFGRGRMPGFGSLLTEEQIERLVAYVGTLGAPR